MYPHLPIVLPEVLLGAVLPKRELGPIYFSFEGGKECYAGEKD